MGVWEEPIRKGGLFTDNPAKKNQAGSHPQELEGPQSVCLCTGDGVTVGPQPALQFLDLGFAPQLFNFVPVISCTPPHGAQLHPCSKCPFVLFSLVWFEIGAQANLLGWLGTHCVAWAALL